MELSQLLTHRNKKIRDFAKFAIDQKYLLENFYDPPTTNVLNIRLQKNQRTIWITEWNFLGETRLFVRISTPNFFIIQTEFSVESVDELIKELTKLSILR